MNSRILRILTIATAVAVLSACSTLKGRETDGVYFAPDGEFSVKVPPVLDVDCDDGKAGASKEYMDCSVGGYYWTAEGGYSV